MCLHKQQPLNIEVFIIMPLKCFNYLHALERIADEVDDDEEAENQVVSWVAVMQPSQ